MSENQVSFLHGLVMDQKSSQANLDQWLVPALRHVDYGEIANVIIALRAELLKWQTGAIVGIEFVPKMFDELERQCDALRTENAMLKADAKRLYDALSLVERFEVDGLSSDTWKEITAATAAHEKELEL